VHFWLQRRRLLTAAAAAATAAAASTWVRVMAESTATLAAATPQNLWDGAPRGDSQHALMSAAMLDAKRARMKVEADREALANRINRLQAEQMRATKRIEETYKRTNLIIVAKERHEASERLKEDHRDANERMLADHRSELKKVKEERRQYAAEQKQRMELERQALIRANKESTMRNEEAIAHARAAELNHAMFKRNEVRRVEADARERKLHEKELMIAHLQQRAGDRHVEEERRAENLDTQLAELERQEYELLVLIEGHRSEQNNLYGDLEEQLGPAGAKTAGLAAMA